MPAFEDRHDVGSTTIRWPSEYAGAGTHFWADQLLSGFRSLGIRIESTGSKQPESSALVLEIRNDDRGQLIAFDHDDGSEIAAEAENVLVYFKQQYAIDGYELPNVVPGGYVLAHNRAYHYLPLLRAIRSLRAFKYDVYGRFGLSYGGVETRRRAVELLSARNDFRSEVSLFRYPGGPDKVPYRKYLFEIPRAKVCVDLPGAGDYCKRLLDYLAVGSCVVRPSPRVRLPVKLIDGEHIVYCARDLSDLGDVCSELVRDDRERERIARNAREFFDRYLHRRQMAAYYLSKVAEARQGLLDTETGRIGRPWQRSSRSTVRIKRAAAAAVAAISLLVVLPEALGDRPYDPRPSAVFQAHLGNLF